MPTSRNTERVESTAHDEEDSSEEVNRQSVDQQDLGSPAQSQTVPDQTILNAILALNPQIRSEIASLLHSQGSTRNDENQSLVRPPSLNSSSSQVTSSPHMSSLLSSAMQNQAFASTNPFASPSMPPQQQISLPLQTAMLHQAILSGMNPSQLYLSSQVTSPLPQGQATSAVSATTGDEQKVAHRTDSLSDQSPTHALHDDSGKSQSMEAKETEEDAATKDETMPSPDHDAKRKSGREQFPEKVFRILTELEREGREDIVSFVRHGSAFQIHKPSEFEAQILPLYFRQGSISSFRRQLNLYGFKRVREEDGSFSELTFCHEKFKQGEPDLCLQIERKNLHKSSVGKDLKSDH